MSKEDMERDIFSMNKKNADVREKVKQEFPDKVKEDFDKFRQNNGKGRISFVVDGNRT